MGEYTYQIVIGLVLLAFFLVTLWIISLQWKNRKAAKGSLWGVFVPEDGDAYGVLCNIDRYKVRPPKKGMHVDKEGNALEEYLIDRGHCASIDWPVNRWRVLQIKVPMAIFQEGNPPAIGLYPGVPIMQSAGYSAATNNESAAYALAGTLERIHNNEQGRSTSKLGNLKWVYIMIAGCMVAIGASVYYVMQMKDVVETRFPAGIM